LSLGKLSDSDATIIGNLKKLTQLIGDIPIGISDSKQRLFTPELVQAILDSNKVYFIVEHSGSRRLLENMFTIVAEYTRSFRIFSGNGTTLLPLLQKGGAGFAGEGCSFVPKIYAWIYKNYQSEAKTAASVSAFVSLSEPIYSIAYPLNLKVFLKLHEELLKDISAFSRSELQIQEASEENLHRLAHLHDAAQFVSAALEEKQGKKKDHSVLL